MMRLLDLSGYDCLRDLAWEEALRPARGNEYFYEKRDFLYTGDMDYMEGFTAGKVMPPGLVGLDPDRVKVIWMDRNRESVLASQAAYKRERLIKKPLVEDYEMHDIDGLLASFVYYVMRYEALVADPVAMLEGLGRFIPLADPAFLADAVDPSRKHF